MSEDCKLLKACCLRHRNTHTFGDLTLFPYLMALRSIFHWTLFLLFSSSSKHSFFMNSIWISKYHEVYLCHTREKNEQENVRERGRRNQTHPYIQGVRNSNVLLWNLGKSCTQSNQYTYECASIIATVTSHNIMSTI